MVCCTIVIPTHNREDLLPRAVRSALAACPADGEVLVVDDKSVVPADEVLRGMRDSRLRVVVNHGTSGAAYSRNLGVGSAMGTVVFFLDDDDEIRPDFCHRILARLAKPSVSTQWGFSGTIERRVGAEDRLRIRKRLGLGPVPLTANPRDVVAALSDGFWIQRQTFLDLGGLDLDQSIDEDTDLCVRLVAQGLQPWYEPEPGMVVYRGYTPARTSGAQLTVATPGLIGLQCYRRSYDKNVDRFGAFSAMRWFLATRYLRRAVKAGYIEDATAFVRQQKPWSIFLALRAYLLAKQLKLR